MISSPTARIATRSKFRNWLDQMKNDPNRQYGLQQAGIEILQGDNINDPWGSLAKGIAGYALGKRQSEERQRVLGIESDERQRRQAREDAQMAQQNEAFALNKRSTEAQLAANEEKRALAEQQRKALIELLPTLPPEDQKLLAPYAADPDKFASVYDQTLDNRRQESQFNRTFEEQQRHTKESERNAAAGLGLERERNQITREGQQLRARGKNKVVVKDGMLTAYDPDGRLISSTALPQNPAEAKAQALKLIATGSFDEGSAMALIDSLDSKLGVQRAVPRASADADPSDSEILDELQQQRELGLTDQQILSTLPPAARARVRALMYAMPGR